MGVINKRSSAYVTMAKSGVTTCGLECVAFNEGQWRLLCIKTSWLPRETAKSNVRQFLEVEFEAFDFQFFGSKRQPEMLFSVVFRSNAL